MTRGRHPFRGRILAQPLARLRGTVGMIEPAPGTLLDLVITSPGSLAAVTIQKADYLHMPASALEARYGDLISRIRLLPQGGPVSREVWYYNRYGTWRFFRIDAAGIQELAADGTIIPGG